MSERLVIWRWWATWSDFGEENYLERYFRSHEQLKDYAAHHAYHESDCTGGDYVSDYERIEVQ